MIKWELHKNNKLWVVARWDHQQEWDYSVDEQLIEVAHWVRDNKFGKRMSYDMFKLNSKTHLTMFLLKWQ